MENPSTFIRHYSLPIKHFNASIDLVPSGSVISSVQPQPRDAQEDPQPVQWEDDPDPVDDVLVSHSMPHVNKLIRKEINFKHPTQNTATFHKLEKSERKAITILEKNLRSTVKPTQRIAQLTETDIQTETPKTVVVEDQQTQCAPTQVETSACPSLSSPDKVSPILWDADDSSVNLIEVTVDEFPTDESLFLDPTTGFFHARDSRYRCKFYTLVLHTYSSIRSPTNPTDSTSYRFCVAYCHKPGDQTAVFSA